MKTWIAVIAMTASVIVVLCGCGDTYVTNIPPGASASASTSGSGGAGGSQAASESAATGVATCAVGEKACGADCVSVDAPATGCGADSCEPCSTPHAVALCANQTCAVDKCVGAWRDCDHAQENGCEADSAADPHNCGGCGHECIAAGAMLGACAGGTCGLGPCSFGYVNCNLIASDGCEVNAIVDKSNCGGCGVVCDAAETCADASCQKCGIETPDPVTSPPGVLVNSGLTVAFDYTPKFSESASKACLYIGYDPIAQFNYLYIMDDNNGAPGAILSTMSIGYGKLPKGYNCFAPPVGSPTVSLTGGTKYWIATNAPGVSGPSLGPIMHVYKSASSAPAFQWVQSPDQYVTLKIVADCN